MLRWKGGFWKAVAFRQCGQRQNPFYQPSSREPEGSPMFCMLLRKHLGSGKLVAVRQLEMDRVLYLDFETTNELGDTVVMTIAVEIMGRHSNIIVINQEGKNFRCD